MIELFLCKAREQKRSIVGLGEHFAIRRFVQKEPIRTILKCIIVVSEVLP